MGRKVKSEILTNKIKKIALRKLTMINILKLFNIFMKVGKENSFEYMKLFIDEYYHIEELFPDEFYNMLINKLFSDDYILFFDKLMDRNIYSLISYIKYNCDDVFELDEVITPLQYYNVSKKYINKIVDKLKELDYVDDNNYLNNLLDKELVWLVKRIFNYTENEYKLLAYKIYLSVGLDNGMEILSGMYGKIDLEKIYFLFSKFDVKNIIGDFEKECFNNFLFNNKKDFNNVFRQMLNGSFLELFLNFDYFYNNIGYFISKLGIRLSKNKVKLLLDDRYLNRNISFPEITGEILDDMLSSYYCKYNFLDEKEEEIYKKNYSIYEEFLRNKYKSSIPMMEFQNNGSFICEIISLNDPRNLVLGYRAGNCFRINGDASRLFNNFLRSEHMRLLSISTIENKDFGMMLIMRNGNVLIGQGIEVSKRIGVDRRKLYDACRECLKEMMDYMNSNGDKIVATIIGSSNSNVSCYNEQILPFLVNPILDDSGNYYNGIYNYQCLLDLCDGKSLSDMKLYIPSVRYFDKRERVLSRFNHGYNEDYMEIEKRLISLRSLRFQEEKNYNFYLKLNSLNEAYVACNKDFYIILFEDGTIDGYIYGDDERARLEYDIEYEKIQHYILKNNLKTTKKKVML